MTGDNENLIATAIDGAEDIADPLDGLVEQATIDPGAPFVPDVLERLCVLKREDRAAFEVLRAQLKKAGCRVTATPFLRKPVSAARILCACQPVAFCNSVMRAPLGRFSSRRIVLALVERAGRGFVGVAPDGLVARRPGRFCGSFMLASLKLVPDGSDASTAHSPATGPVETRRAAPGGSWLTARLTVTLSSRGKSSEFGSD